MCVPRGLTKLHAIKRDQERILFRQSYRNYIFQDYLSLRDRRKNVHYLIWYASVDVGRGNIPA